MMGAALRYREMMIKLFLQRELVQGGLSQSEEAHFAQALDDCWREMTEPEQRSVEDLLARGEIPGAPASLGLIDTRVTNGDHGAPRRAA